MAIQRFIELGDGYSDLYELLEIAIRNKDRVIALLSLDTSIDGKEKSSFVVILSPVEPSNFQPIYICREGIQKSPVSKRRELFETTSKKLNKEIISLEVKPSIAFNETSLYYQYLIGVLRMNRIILPL